MGGTGQETNRQSSGVSRNLGFRWPKHNCTAKDDAERLMFGYVVLQPPKCICHICPLYLKPTKAHVVPWIHGILELRKGRITGRF